MPRPIPIGAAIELIGGNNNGYLISNPARLDGGAGFEISCLFWYKLITTGINRRWLRKTSVFDIQMINNEDDDIFWTIGRDTTEAVAKTNSNWVAIDNWGFFATTYDETDGPRVFVGSETVPAVESSYATRNVGAGNTSSNTNDINMYYRASSSRTIDGLFAYTHIINRRLSLAQVLQLQYNPGLAVENTEILYHPGADGNILTLKDYSGNGNDGVRQGSGQQLAAGPSVGWGRTRGGLLVPPRIESVGGIVGIADFSLPSLGLTAIGDIPIDGIADFALPVLIITGSGTRGDGTGVADFDLPNLIVTGIGDIPLAGIADFDLPVPTITGIGSVATGAPVLGDADFNLPIPTITGIGDIPIAGLADFALPVPTITGVGVLPISGTADFSLPVPIITGIGDVPRTGSADFNLPAMNIPAVGDILVAGTADFALPNLLVNATGVIGTLSTVDGAADFSLPSLWIQTQGGVDIPMVNIYSITGQTGANTGTAFTLERRAGAWLINRDVLAQVILGAGSATIHIEVSLDGGSTFADIVSSLSASAAFAFNLPPIIRVRLSAATGATVNVWLDADLVVTRVDN